MKIVCSILIIFASVMSSRAQFRPGFGLPQEKPVDARTAMTSSTSFLSSLFDPERFSMRQTYSMSFMSGAGYSLGLSALTNTFAFKAADNLFFSADVSAVYSPYSSLGTAHSKSLNGIYLTNARMDWRLGEHTSLHIIYSAPPAGSFMYDPSPFSLWR
jgi:hypothetical protein